MTRKQILATVLAAAFVTGSVGYAWAKCGFDSSVETVDLEVVSVTIDGVEQPLEPYDSRRVVLTEDLWARDLGYSVLKLEVTPEGVESPELRAEFETEVVR